MQRPFKISPRGPGANHGLPQAKNLNLASSNLAHKSPPDFHIVIFNSLLGNRSQLNDYCLQRRIKGRIMMGLVRACQNVPPQISILKQNPKHQMSRIANILTKGLLTRDRLPTIVRPNFTMLSVSISLSGIFTSHLA
jgi:hypothetical protein